MNVPNFVIKHVMLRSVYQHHASNLRQEQHAAQQLALSLSLSMLKNIQQNFRVKHNLTLYLFEQRCNTEKVKYTRRHIQLYMS